MAKCGMCEGAAGLSLCERCRTNLEMMDLAQAFEEQPCEVQIIGGVPFCVSESCPANEIYLIPSREVLEQVAEEEPTADLRRYFGSIKNLG